MGMYTGIRFKGYLKPEFRENFDPIANRGEWNNSNDPILSAFGALRRAPFIPCGVLYYMPEEWEETLIDKESGILTFKDRDGFNRTWNKDTGYWAFQCSLKNYGCEIEEWFDIIPHFVEKIIHLEKFYEEWIYSERYDLINNEIKLVDDEFIKYGYE